MKKLSLGKLRLLSEEVLERSQLAGIYGGSGLGSGFGCFTKCVEGCGGATNDCKFETMDDFCHDDGGWVTCSCR